MFRLTELTSLNYQDFCKLLDLSQEGLYRKIFMALGVSTDRELAQMLGVSEQAVNNAKRNGKIPDRWIMYTVCKSGLSLPLLLTLSEDKLNRAISEPDKYSYALVPMLKSLQYPKGENYSEYVDSYLAVQKEFLLKVDAKTDEIIATIERGHAMEPTVKRGDSLIISLTQKTFSPGGIFIISLEDTRMLCRLHRIADKFRIIFDNPSIPDFELDNVSIFGRVLWIGREM